MKYDLAIMGGGPAGYSAALEAVRAGLKTVLFEYDLLGGTCLNRGCVPTKFLIRTAEVYSALKYGAKYGIESDVRLNYKTALSEQAKIVNTLRDGLNQLLSENKIDVIRQMCRMTDENHIQTDDAVYDADIILIATGSVPAKPFVDNAITSTELLKLDHIPESMAVIGGGVVAVEFAWIFKSLGADVSLNIRGNRILRKWDKDLSVGLTQSFKKKGIVINTGCTPEQFEKISAEVILSAVGRVPNLSGVSTEKLHIGEDGGIIVDEFGYTGIKGIYAAGDVISGSVQLAHTAMEQGKRAVQHAAGIKVQNRSAVVSCIYTDPETASVGHTEKSAGDSGINAVSAKYVLNSNAKKLITSDEREFIKLVADKDSRKIIGAQLMCQRASDIISEIALAVNNEITADEFYTSTRPHPSFCEALSEAAGGLVDKLNKERGER